MNTGNIFLYAFIGFFIYGCVGDDPGESNNQNADASTGTVSGHDCDVSGDFEEDLSNCEPAATDYQPRVNNSADDSWAKCISDDNSYHLIADSPSSIARVEAYDAAGKLLWNNSKIPTAEDFTKSRIIIDSDQGLGSRLDRRYDVHYDAPPSGAKCDEEGIASQYPDYCVGPGKLRPILNEAFKSVANGGDPVINAARIHAALQWFLYVSVVKEATTCTEKAKDCDSSWAYYSGGTARNSVIGLAKEIKSITPLTHDRIYDGNLAVGCWRFLDDGETAKNLSMRDLAIKQMDTALLYAMSTLVIEQFLKINCSTGSYKKAALAELEILISLLDLETRKRSKSVADLLKTEIEKDIDNIDTANAIKSIKSIYLCP